MHGTNDTRDLQRTKELSTGCGSVPDRTRNGAWG